jgi:peptide deformylase
MTYNIVKYGDPVLETKGEPVTDFNTPELKTLVDDMFEAMYAAKGLGLAAPQIGISKQLAVIDPSAGEDPTAKLVIINPEIVEKSGRQVGEEGCLSIPGFREDVTRHMHLKLRYQDIAGLSHELEADDLLARAIQHETDHLNGILFLNHLSMLKRDLSRRKIRKLVKLGDW